MSAGSGVGAGAAIVGTELQGWAALLDKWAMQDAYQKQAQLQGQYRQQATQAFNTGLAGMGSDQAAKDLSVGAQNRQSQYAQANATPLSVQGSPLSGLLNARVQAAAQLSGGQRATLGSYGDWLQNQYMRNQNTNRQLNQISNFAGGSASVFPLQMYAAQHSMDDLAAVGQAISSLGGAAGNYMNLYGSTPTGNNLSAPNFSYSGVSGGYDLPNIQPVNDVGSSQSVYALG